MSEENNKKSEAALREEKVLEFWRENKIFEKSLEQRKGKKTFIFYDGPVTANSKPVLHTMVPFSFKDVLPRYKTMRGYYAPRKGGWDTHGLPVELQIEKKLGFKSKVDIENYGIAQFNQLCKDSVWEFVGLWKNFTKRMGYWADQEKSYVTYHNSYIESLWNIVKEVNKKKLLYKDYKVVPWCPRCGTALSSHELAQGYEDVKDLSIYAKFKLISPSQSSGQPHMNTYVVAWTTTPWTLPGNIALAVGQKIDYVKVKVGEEFYILAKARLSVLMDKYEVVAEMKGKDLLGFEYEPLFPYLKDLLEKKGENVSKAFKVYGADFVTTEDGTGVVHTAVMYGQDDFELGTKVGLPKFHLVNPEGKFISGTGFLEGRYVKEADENGKPTLAVDIVEDLKKRNLFFKKENYDHSYPHCWRCHTALIYYARDSWYIKMSDPKVKKELLSENKKINWEPSHIRDGRFGEWLREIKDWAISRERYWGTPLPVWVCEKCEKKHVIGSLLELEEKVQKSGNRYFVMRHGEAENNVLGLNNSDLNKEFHLTLKGREEVKKSIEKIKKIKPDYIFSSPIFRAKETAEMVKAELKLGSSVVIDDRLWEVRTGEFEGKSYLEYEKFYKNDLSRFTLKPSGGECLNDVRKRVGEFVYELEKKYKNKKILIVTHEDSIWMLESVARGHTAEESLQGTGFKTGQVGELNFSVLPHNPYYELDLHRPFIDEIKLVCAYSTSSGQACEGTATRTKEVMDVWFDSGAMPFAQDHYPFENKKWVDGKGFPADYISEAIDQTRGWFYTLHAVGVLMGRGRAYKNVICLGHLLDAEGKKMSKSVGNVVDPWLMIEKYGVDTLRLWMYSVNQPGESKNFDEKTVALLSQQVFGLLYNVLAFYELYRDKKLEKNTEPKSKNILDKWILSRLNELIKMSTQNLDNYKLLEPTRATRDFIGDLSTWYLRRSRERIKDGDKDAKATLYYVFKNLVKLMAPFAPLATEDIWLRLKNEKDKESVHLTDWPKAGKIDKTVIKTMQVTQDLCTAGNRIRKTSNIPIRQPLKTFFVPGDVPEAYEQIIKDELNVKEVKKGGEEPYFDQNITEDLKEEGNYRELLRVLQDMRKKSGLTPRDVISLYFSTDKYGEEFIRKFEPDIKKTVLVAKLEFKEMDGEAVKVGDYSFKIKITK